MLWTPRARGMSLSALVHLGALLALGVMVAYWPETLPDPVNRLVGCVWIDPAAAAALPLPKGTSRLHRLQPAETTPPPIPPPDTLIEPETRPEPVEPETAAPAEDRFGSETGSDSGTDEGMDGGVPGGQPEGIPGGNPDGCVGCTGEGPVLDYDQGPRLLKSTRPVYPQDAFIKKIEGVVTVQFVIDTNGMVGSVRVIRSVPLLDQAAIESVRQWRFAPAVKKGRAVSTLATAPVSFRIF